jgi:hypothetical protein
MMDGTHTVDELCCRFLKPYHELEELATADEGMQVIVLYK